MLLDCGAKTVRRCGREGHLRKGQLSRNVTGWVGFAGGAGPGAGCAREPCTCFPLGRMRCGAEHMRREAERSGLPAHQRRLGQGGSQALVGEVGWQGHRSAAPWQWLAMACIALRNPSGCISSYHAGCSKCARGSSIGRGGWLPLSGWLPGAPQGATAGWLLCTAQRLAAA